MSPYSYLNFTNDIKEKQVNKWKKIRSIIFSNKMQEVMTRLKPVELSLSLG